MRKFLISLITLSLLLSIVSLGVYAYAPHLDNSKEYEIITPDAVTAVYLKEDLYSGHTHMDTTISAGIATSFDVASTTAQYSEFFDLDSRMEGLPTWREHTARYDEQFFETHVLIIVNQEGHHYLNGEPASKPVHIENVYLQDGYIYVEYTGERVITEQLDLDKPLEYHHFIEIKKSDLQNYDFDTENFYQKRPIMLNANNPDTADPVLSFTALAVASTALLAAGVSLGRQRRRDK